MSFIFRTIFWLSAAAVILPPGSRLGGQEVADFRDFDLEYELRGAAMSAWSAATEADASCREYPQFCQSVASLWTIANDTLADIARKSATNHAADEEQTRTAANSRRESAEN